MITQYKEQQRICLTRFLMITVAEKSQDWNYHKDITTKTGPFHHYLTHPQVSSEHLTMISPNWVNAVSIKTYTDLERITYKRKYTGNLYSYYLLR